MRPVLAVLNERGRPLSLGELEPAVAAALGVSREAAAALLPSGRGTALAGALGWAVHYLAGDGLVEMAADGTVGLTAAGQAALAGPAGAGFAEDAEPFDRYAYAGAQMARYHRHLTDELVEDLLGRIHAQTPQFFERLIVSLLPAMGYGRGGPELARQLGRSGDGGVDGVIYLDDLGLDRLYVQAKRYRPGILVPVAAVRDFAGSLEAHKAGKGVFVTTSDFSAGAAEFVEALPRRIVLMPGRELAMHMIRLDIGVTCEATYAVKRLVPDFFRA